MGQDPRNVQAVVRRDPHGRESLLLMDVDGVFVDAGPLGEPERSGAGNGEVDGYHEEGSDLSSERGSPTFPGRTELVRQRAENATLVAQNAELAEEASSLKEEVTKVKDSLGKESERVRELWKTNCAQVASFDTAITAKDNEIESLRARVAELEAAAGSVPTHCHPYSSFSD